MKRIIAIFIILVLCVQIPTANNTEGAVSTTTQQTENEILEKPIIPWSVPLPIIPNATLGPIIKTDSNYTKYHLVWVENNTTLIYGNFISPSAINKSIINNTPLPIIGLDYGLSQSWHVVAFALSNYSIYALYSKDFASNWTMKYIGQGINPTVYVDCIGMEMERAGGETFALAKVRIGYQKIVSETLSPDFSEFELNNTVLGDGIRLATHSLTLPEPLYYSQSVVFNNTIYIIGGTVDGIHGSKAIYRFEAEQRRIEIAGYLPFGLFGHVAFAYANAIYIAGGCIEQENFTDAILRFWPQNGTVEVLSLKLPAPMAFGAAAVHQPSATNPSGEVWIVPGGVGLLYGKVAGLWRFRDENVSSEGLPAQPTVGNITIQVIFPPPWENISSYSHMGAVMNGDCLFIFGGMSDGNFVNKIYKIWIYDGAMEVAEGALPFGVADMGYYMAGNTIYMFGGRTEAGITKKIVECYFQPWSYPWDEPKVIGELEEGIYGLSVCRLRQDTQFYLFGGCNGNIGLRTIKNYKIMEYRQGNLLYSTDFNVQDAWSFNASDGNVVEITPKKVLSINASIDKTGYAYAVSPNFLPPIGISDFELSIDFMLPYYDNQMFWLLKGEDWGIGVERNYSRPDEFGSMMYVDSSGHYSFITYIWPEQWHNLRVVYAKPYFYVFLDEMYCGMYERPEVITAKIKIGDIGEPADAYGTGYFDNFMVYSISILKRNVFEDLPVYYEEGSCAKTIALGGFGIAVTPYWSSVRNVSGSIFYEGIINLLSNGEQYNFSAETTEFRVMLRLSTQNPTETPVLQSLSFALLRFDTLSVYEWIAWGYYYTNLKRWLWDEEEPTEQQLYFAQQKLVGKLKFVDNSIYAFAKGMETRATRILCYDLANNTITEIANVSGNPYYGFDVCRFRSQIWVVYSANETGIYQLYMLYSRDSGQSWYKTRLTFGPGNAKRPVIGLDNKKNVHVVYACNEEYYWNLKYLKFDSGKRNVSEEQRITNITSAEVYGYYTDGTPFAGAVSFAFCTDISGNPRLVLKEASGAVRYMEKVPDAQDLVEVAKSTLQALPDTAFADNPEQKRNALLNKYDAVENMIEANNTKGAIKKMKEDIRPKTEGQWINEESAVNEMKEINTGIMASLEGPQVTIQGIYITSATSARIEFSVIWDHQGPNKLEAWVYNKSNNACIFYKQWSQVEIDARNTFAFDVYSLTQHVDYYVLIKAVANDGSVGKDEKTFNITFAITNVVINMINEGVQFEWDTTVPSAYNTLTLREQSNGYVDVGTFSEINPGTLKTHHKTDVITELEVGKWYKYWIHANSIVYSSTFLMDPLWITDVSVSRGSYDATITWKTNKNANTELWWKIYMPENSDYGWCRYFKDESTKVHTVFLQNLNPAEFYEYEIVATATINGQAYTASARGNFTTASGITKLAVEDYYNSTRNENGVRIYWESADATTAVYEVQIWNNSGMVYSNTTQVAAGRNICWEEISLESSALERNSTYTFKVLRIENNNVVARKETSHTVAQDTDGDGLTDAEELTGWDVKTYFYRSDKDKIYEMWHSHFCSPINNGDADGDGWNDSMEKRARTKPTPASSGGAGGGGGGQPPLICSVSGYEITGGMEVNTDGKDTDWDGVWDREDINPLMDERMKVRIKVKDIGQDVTLSEFLVVVPAIVDDMNQWQSPNWYPNSKKSAKVIFYWPSEKIGANEVVVNIDDAQPKATVGLWDSNKGKLISIEPRPTLQSNTNTQKYTIELKYVGVESTRGYTHYWYGLPENPNNPLYTEIKDEKAFEILGQRPEEETQDCWAKIDLQVSLVGKDVDGDRIHYWSEVKWGTDPNVAEPDIDRDGDGMPLWLEERYFFDDNNPADAWSDDDKDSFYNIWEARLGRNPRDKNDVYRIYLNVSVGWSASLEEIEAIEWAFKGASLYLMTVTDGFCYISNVTIYVNPSQIYNPFSPSPWFTSDIRIYNVISTSPNWWEDWGIYWPHVGGSRIGGYWGGTKWLLDDEVVLPKGYVLKNGPQIDIGEAFYACTIVHELGHYIFGVYDEYDTTYQGTHYDGLGDYRTLMNRDGYFLSYRSLYSALSYTTKTMQWVKKGESCWETFIKTMRAHGLTTDTWDFDPTDPGYIPYAAPPNEGQLGIPNINLIFSSHLFGPPPPETPVADIYIDWYDWTDFKFDVAAPNMMNVTAYRC